MTEFKGLSARARNYRIIAMSAVCTLAWLFLLWFIIFFEKPTAFAPLMTMVAIIAMVIVFVYTVLNAVVSSMAYRYKIDETGFTIIRSFIYKKQIFVPKSKILGYKRSKKAIFCKGLYKFKIVNDSDGVFIRYLTLSEMDFILKESAKEASVESISTEYE